MNQAEWYYSQDGQQFGPMPFETLKHLVTAGHVRTADLVWRVGFSEWYPASQLEAVSNEAVPVDGPTIPPPLPTERKAVPPPLPRTAPSEQKRRPRELPEQSSNKGNRTLLIVVVSIAGTLLLCCVGSCVLMGLIGSRQPVAKSEPTKKTASDKASETQINQVDEPKKQGPKADPEVIRATFLPHKPGTAARYINVLVPQPRENPLKGQERIAFQDLLSYYKNGVIRHDTESTGKFDPEAVDSFPRHGLLTKSNYTSVKFVRVHNHGQFYRQRGEYVEVGDASEVLADGDNPENERFIRWKPLLKIGTRLGDSWEATLPQTPTLPKVTVQYTVKAFGKHTLTSETTPRITVTVQEDTIVDGTLFATETATYLEGIGLLDKAVYLVNGKDLVPARCYLLVDGSNGFLTTREKKFFLP